MSLLILLVRINALHDSVSRANESVPAGNENGTLPAVGESIVQVPKRRPIPCAEGQRRAPSGKCRKVW